MKDPAFLFYSNDFYAGTRTMLPEERACYMDLLIYQHQNEFIPSDLKRVLLFCSGIDKATLEATLEAKFEKTEKGWVNRKLKAVVAERKNYKDHQSLNGIIGAFWKKAMKTLKKTDYKKVRQIADNQYNKDEFHSFIVKHGKDPSRVALAMLKHLEDEIEDEIESKDEDRLGEIKRKLNFNLEFKKIWKKYFPLQIISPSETEIIRGLKFDFRERIKEQKKSENILGYSVPDREVLEAVEIVLEKLPDFWKDKIDLQLFRKKLNSIIQQIGTSKNHSNGSSKTKSIVTPEKAQRVFEDLMREGTL